MNNGMNETCTKYAIYCEDNGKDSLCVVVDSLADAQKEKGAYVGKKGRIEESKVENFGKDGEKVVEKKVIENWEAGGAGAKLSEAQQQPSLATPIATPPASPPQLAGGGTAITPPVKELSPEEKWKEFFTYYIGHGSWLGKSYNLPKPTEEPKKEPEVKADEVKKEDEPKPDFTVEEYVDAIELKHGKESLKKAKEIIEQKMSPVSVA